MLTLEEIRAHFRRHDPVSSSLGIEVLDVGREYSLVEMPPHGCQLNGMGAVHDGAVFGCGVCGAFQCERPVLHECPDLHFVCAFRPRGAPAWGSARAPFGEAAFHIRGPGNRCRRGPCGRGDHNRLWRRRAASSGGCIAFAGSASGVSVAGCTQRRRRRVPCLSPPCGLFWA